MIFSDPMMLLGVVNTKLRDEPLPPEDICEELGASFGEISAILAESGYTYDDKMRKFRAAE